jgi:hypothetical protein
MVLSSCLVISYIVIVPHLQSDVHHILPQKRGYPWRDSGLVGAANIRWKQVLDNLYDGVIGNCRSAASISKDAGIDWCCLPEFNSSSVFARILDRGRPDGHFHSRRTRACSEDLWTIVRSLVRTVSTTWRNPGKGIREIRSQEQHFRCSAILSAIEQPSGETGGGSHPDRQLERAASSYMAAMFSGGTSACRLWMGANT